MNINIFGRIKRFSSSEMTKPKGHTHSGRFSISAKVGLLFASVLLALFLCAPIAYGQAIYYVRAGATGANNGSDWVNAYTVLPATLVRGATYYIADGSYPAYTFNTPDSGTNYIYVVKATVADHGTDTGWDDSYGDGQAIFAGLSFSANYIVVDGQVGQWASDWPGYEQHGFVVRRAATSNNSYLIRVGAYGNLKGNIIIKHVEAYWTNTTTWYKSQFHWYGYVSTVATLEYCWFHLGGGSVMTHLNGQLVLDHCVVEENGNAQAVMNWSPHEHSVLLQIRSGGGSTDGSEVKRSLFRRFRSSGGLILYSDNKDILIHGNIFTLDPNGGTSYGKPYSGGGNGVLNGYGAGVNYQRNMIVNNTFVDISPAGQICSIGGWGATNEVRNNIFYNVKNAGGNIALGSITRTHNWYYDVGTVPTETNRQIGSGAPFVDRDGKNYRLISGTDPGYSQIGEVVNVDIDGSIRGVDGLWSRGAFEFTVGSVSVAPPSGLVIIR